MCMMLRISALVATICVVCGVKVWAADTEAVTVDNFIRAESDMYMAGVALKQGGFGKLFVRREVSPIEDQDVIRQNRDTLYAAQVFDLDAGPVTIKLPDAGKRFISMQAIDEDEYVPAVVYDSEPHTFTKEQIGTRYMIVAFRILVNPADPKRRGPGARITGQDQNRATGRARQVRDTQLGSPEPG